MKIIPFTYDVATKSDVGVIVRLDADVNINNWSTATDSYLLGLRLCFQSYRHNIMFVNYAMVPMHLKKAVCIREICCIIIEIKLHSCNDNSILILFFYYMYNNTRKIL